MNASPHTKCRSAQQIMNDLTKLVTAKEYTSKKTADVLRELTVCYASPNASTLLPPSVLKDLCTLLKHLKDKKDDIRIAKFAYSFLSRAISQLEALSRQNEHSDRFEGIRTPLRELLQEAESSEIAHSNVWRQHAGIKMYAHLCSVFDKRDAFFSYAKSVLSTSPVWSSMTLHSKRKLSVHSFLPSTLSSKKDISTHLSVLNATLHGVRHHLNVQQQSLLLDKLFEASFCLQKMSASRHASAILFKVFECGTEYATKVIRALEVHIVVSKPISLYLGDVMASIYMIHLCGMISRLQVGQMPDSMDLLGADDITRVVVPQHVSNCVREWILDLIVGYLSASNSNQEHLPRAVLAVALEESIIDLSADALRAYVRGSLTIFEVVSAAIMKLLRDPSTHNNSIGLHRVYRIIETAARSLDSVTLKRAHYDDAYPNYLSKLTEKMIESVCHPNEFVAVQCFLGLLWLLPRPKMSDGNTNYWNALIDRLINLSEDQIPSQQRVSIATALFERAVTSPKLHSIECDTEILGICLAVVLLWFRANSCVWHGDILLSIWRVSCSLPSMQTATFTSIQLVLGFYDTENRCISTIQSQTLWYLYEAAGSIAENPHWAQSLIVQLTRYVVLASHPLRRASMRVLQQIRSKAYENLNGQNQQKIIDSITNLMESMTASPSASNRPLFLASELQAHTLGLIDVLMESSL